MLLRHHTPDTGARGGARPYLLAAAWSAFFVLLRLALEPVLDGQAPLIVLLAAPILAARTGGWRGGATATVLCAAAGELLFVHATSGTDAPAEWTRLAIFLGYGFLFSWLIATRRRALSQLTGEHDRLQHAQAQLALRERRVRETLEASPSGMLVTNRDGGIELVNGQAEHLFGYSRGELVGMSIDQLVPDGVRPRHAGNREHYHHYPTSRPMGTGRDLLARRKDGSVFPVEIGLSPLPGESAGLVLASVVDISARKQAEQALQGSEQRAHEMAQRAEAQRALLDATLDAAPAGIILADASGKLVRSNPANTRIWGNPPATNSIDEYAEWKGWWADKSPRHGERIEAHEWAMARALRGELVQEDLVEIEPFDAPGMRRTMVNSAAPVRDAQGRVTGAVVVQTDISALATAQQALMENEALFRSLADNIPQLAWMADETGAMTWYNQRWYDYTGSTLEQARDWGWEGLHHPDHLQRVVDKFRQHLRTGEPWEDTFPLRGRDGAYRWFLSRAFPLRDSSGKLVSWFGTNTDVNAQRQAEEALREADRRKDEFIAMLAHELRNPLAPMRNAVEILKRLGPPEPRLMRARDIIGRQVTHMARLIDDLLDVSRIARGKLMLHVERCDAAAIVRETAEDYRPTVEAAGQQLQLRGTAGPVWVQGDPVRIAQMLSNLLSNAVRFNNPQGTVDIGIEAQAGHASISVADTGVGMDAELLARLFDPFSQAVQDLARTKGGLGLGLALTKGLADLHGGTIAAHSAGLGQGARFTLSLPLLQPEPASQADGHGQADGAPSAGLRILLVEDNQDAAATLGELLQMMGHQVTLAFDGTAGIDKARQMRPDVVISDIGLPGDIDGFGVARALRQEPTLAGTVLMALSGYADPAARRRCTEAGFDEHIVKPPDLVALEAVLARIDEQRHAGIAAGQAANPAPSPQPSNADPTLAPVHV